MIPRFSAVCHHKTNALNENIHGFPQVLRTWAGALKNLMGSLSQYKGGAWGLKMVSKIPVKEFIC